MPPRPTTHSPPEREARRARPALAAVFFANGFGLGSWVPHIADVKLALGLSDGTLGLALFAMAAGSLAALPAAGLLTARHGSRATARAAAGVFCAALPLPLLAPDLMRLMLALSLLGIVTGALDVAINAHAVEVEARYRRPIMSSFHGLFSAGGLAGAAGAAAAMRLGVGPRSHLALVAVALAAGLLPALAHLLPTAPVRPCGPTFARPRGRLIGLGALAFGGLMAEGAMGDWSALYMRDALRADPATAALGFAAFSLAMAVGRLTGDRIVGRFGAVGVLSPGAATAAGALGLALIAGQPAVGVLGFAAVGLGLANLIPVVFGAAGRLPEFPAGVGIAAVSTAGYCGFLAGPPLIGLVAEGAGLTTGLALVAGTLAAIALGSDALGKHLEEAVATA